MAAAAWHSKIAHDREPAGTTEADEGPDAASPGDLLAAVASALDAGAVLVDGDDVLLANDAAHALRVVRPGAAGTPGALAHPPLVRLARDARRTSSVRSTDLDLPWGSETRAVHVTAVPLDATAQVVVLLVDVTEARRVEAVRRDFVANVSHELKTPVGALSLLAEAILDGQDDPELVRRFSRRMLLESTRMSRLVQELLDLSRLQGGEPLPAPAAVPVARVVGEAVDRNRLAADAAGTTVAANIPPGVVVWGDSRSLVTAIANLIENAVHYSPAGTTVGVSARRRGPGADEQGDWVEVSVADEGIGIAPADADRVFERFYRADQARSRQTGGTGLGLAIVKHIAANHGGRVTVWSVEGAGSTFTLHLPGPPALPEPAATGAPASAPTDVPLAASGSRGARS